MSRRIAASVPRGVVWLLVCALLSMTVLAGCVNEDEATDTANQQEQSQAATTQADIEEGLSAEEGQEEQTARALARELLAEARAHEPAITQKLQSLEDDTAKLAGLDFRLKGEDSLTRKIVSDAHDKEIPLDEAAAAIHDVIRYTLCIEPAEYVGKVTEVLKELESDGYTVTKFKNMWANDLYKGLNTHVMTPDGTVVEIQFHTPESYETKELQHEYYEITRSEDATEEEVAEAARKQRELTGSITIPPHAIDLDWELE